jgi:type I restriction enzyme S subunit
MEKKKEKISDIAIVQSGSGFPTKYQGGKEGEYPFYKVSDMNLPGNERILINQNNLITEETRSTLNAKIFPKGSILFPKIGAAIATNKKRITSKPCCADNNVMGIIPNADAIDPEYLYYLLLEKNLSDFASASNPPSIRKTVVEDFEIYLPKPQEQRRIVDILKRAEGIVRLRKEQLEKTRALIPALFIDMFGDPATNPKGWDVKPFENIVVSTQLGVVRSAKEMSDEKPIPYLKMDSINNDGSINSNKYKKVDASHEELQKYLLKFGDFLFNTRNSYELVGKAAIFLDEVPGAIYNNNIMRVQFDTKLAVPEYVTHYFQTKEMQNELKLIKKGTTSVFAIYYKNLKDVPLLVPPVAEQKQFSKKFLEIHQAIQELDNALKKQEALFQSLLHGAFNGEL